jgi:hypothetical protein
VVVFVRYTLVVLVGRDVVMTVVLVTVVFKVVVLLTVLNTVV